MNNDENKPEKDYKYIVILFQGTVCILLICAALTIKILGGGFYRDVRNWYKDKFDVDTSLEEVINPPSDFSSFESTGYTVYQ